MLYCEPYHGLCIYVCEDKLHALKDRAIEGVHIPEGLIECSQRTWERCLNISTLMLYLVMQLPMQVALQVPASLRCGAAGDDCCQDVVLVCLQP